MQKKRCTDQNQILSRNLKCFEHKSERNLCEIYKILRPPHRFHDFREIWNVRDQISGREMNFFGQISIRFGTEMNQISVRNVFQMRSKFLCHADLHKNESTSVNDRKCVLKCVRQSARFLQDSDQIWNGNLIDFCSKTD